MNARRKGKGRAPVWHVGWEHIEEGAAADTSPRREGTGGSRKGTGRTPTTKHAIATRMLKHASGRIGGGGGGACHGCEGVGEGRRGGPSFKSTQRTSTALTELSQRSRRQDEYRRAAGRVEATTESAVRGEGVRVGPACLPRRQGLGQKSMSQCWLTVVLFLRCARD